MRAVVSIVQQIGLQKSVFSVQGVHKRCCVADPTANTSIKLESTAITMEVKSTL